MKTVNLTIPGEDATARTRGHKGKQAGASGIRVYDTGSGDISPAPEIEFVGATVTGEDGEVAIVTVTATGQQATNASGIVLEYGDVVVLTATGTITTTTTAQDTRPVGVVQIGGADGIPVSVVFSGYVAQVNVTASVTAGNYAETSTTAGDATESAIRRPGSFAVFLATGTAPSALLFGIPDSAGALTSLIVISPAQITANTDNWNPTDLATADVIRASTDASRNLTGIVAPASTRTVILENVGAFDLVLKHDVTSTAANRFYCPNDTDLTLQKDSAVVLVYDLTSTRWRVVGGSGGSGTFATPAIVLGTAAAAGAASTVIRSDATILAFDATVPVADGGSGAAGSATVAPRRDHKHPGDVLALNFVIDGGGAVVTTGTKGLIEVPFACTITAARLAANASGSVIVDVKKATYAGLFTTTSICASAKPTLSSAQKNQDTTLTGWTTSIAAGDWLEFVVDGSPATIARVTLSLTLLRS